MTTRLTEVSQLDPDAHYWLVDRATGETRVGQLDADIAGLVVMISNYPHYPRNSFEDTCVPVGDLFERYHVTVIPPVTNNQLALYRNALPGFYWYAEPHSIMTGEFDILQIVEHRGATHARFIGSSAEGVVADLRGMTRIHPPIQEIKV